MCGRVIQSSGPLRLAIVEGLNVSDNRMGNVPARYNAAPSQNLTDPTILDRATEPIDWQAPLDHHL